MFKKKKNDSAKVIESELKKIYSKDLSMFEFFKRRAKKHPRNANDIVTHLKFVLHASLKPEEQYNYIKLLVQKYGADKLTKTQLFSWEEAEPYYQDEAGWNENNYSYLLIKLVQDTNSNVKIKSNTISYLLENGAYKNINLINSAGHNVFYYNNDNPYLRKSLQKDYPKFLAKEKFASKINKNHNYYDIHIKCKC